MPQESCLALYSLSFFPCTQPCLAPPPFAKYFTGAQKALAQFDFVPFLEKQFFHCLPGTTFP